MKGFIRVTDNEAGMAQGTGRKATRFSWATPLHALRVNS